VLVRATLMTPACRGSQGGEGGPKNLIIGHKMKKQAWQAAGWDEFVVTKTLGGAGRTKMSV